MAYRLYITPAVGDPFGEFGRRPKYFDGLTWAGYDYGFQPVYMVASDTTPAQDSSITANADVYALPLNLDSNMSGGQINQARSALENTFLIPAQWVSAPLTGRGLARMCASIFGYMGALNVTLGNEVLIDNTTKLNIQWQTIPLDPYQTAMMQAAMNLNYVFNPQPTDQLRKIMEDLANQGKDKPYRLLAFVF